MSASQPRLPKDGETVDLTVTEPVLPRLHNPRPGHSASMAVTQRTDRTQVPTQDHMHPVVAALLRPALIDLTGDEPDTDVAMAASLPRRLQNLDRLQSQASTEDPEIRASPLSRGAMRPCTEQTGSPGLKSTSPLDLGPQGRPFSPPFAQRQGHRSGKKRLLEPFPFLNLPPEIRNYVYRILLTTPNVSIEFPGLTARNRARHRAQWAKCTTVKMRRKHKKLFLEILQTSKRIHDEASGIIYGCNVFKYRSNPGEGYKLVVLPTRYLQLLKHIKISVVSRHPHDGQSELVANLIKQFIKDDLMLETFEITWFGWVRYQLQQSDPVCQALRLLRVTGSFVMRVTGEARMGKEMQEELEQSLISRTVEIQRPVKAVTGEELSEDSAS